MILYLVYSVAFVNAIARRLYPVADEIVKQQPKVSRLLGKKKNAPDETSAVDIAARPEVLQVILTVLYMIIMMVVTYVKFDGL